MQQQQYESVFLDFCPLKIICEEIFFILLNFQHFLKTYNRPPCDREKLFTIKGAFLKIR